MPTPARFTRALRLLALALLASAALPRAGQAQAGAAFQLFFPTVATVRPPEVFIGAGDIADCGEALDEQTAELVEQIPGAVFTLGDNAYDNATTDEYNHCYDPTWGRFKARTFPVPGNHEYNTPGAQGYFDYFGPAAHPLGGYYSYDLGAWHILALNSNCDDIGGCQAGSPEEEWLRADLAAHPAACILAYWHHPRFTSGPHADDARFVPFWQDLYAAHADLVLNGHDHDYERFAPQTPDGQLDWDHGIREFVVGTGGRHFSAFGLGRRPNSEVSKDVIYGVLKLTLYPASYAWQFVPVPGMSFNDAGTMDCH